MNTKRFISIALTVLMLLTTSTVAFAAGTFTIVAPKVTEELEVGKTIEYKIDPTENPGYAVGVVTVKWDNTAFELTDVAYGAAKNNGSPKISNTGSYQISFGDDLATENYTSTDTLFTLTFKILDAATEKEYPIELVASDSDFLDADINKVTVSCQNGSITLTGKPVPATSVAVDKATVSIDEGQTETVTATVKPDDTTDTLEWKSADTSIATVADGVITGVKEGTTTVTATAGSKSATVSVTVTKPACVHNWVAGTPVEPTCTEEGYTEYTCSICSETKKDDVKSALGHDYKDTVVEPTCTEQGYTTHVCSRCGDKIVDSYKEALGHKSDTYAPKDDNNHTLTCSVCGLETVEAHTWKTEVTKEATHLEEGEKTLTCEKCGATKTETIDKTTEHTYENYTDNGDGTHSAECACGEKLTEDHDFDQVEITKEPTKEETGEMTYTCSLCGATKVEEIPVLNDEQDMVAIMMTLRRAQEQILAKKRAAEAAKKAAEEAAKKAAEAAATPAKAPLPFTDVETITNMYDIVEYVYDNGIMNGVSATEFDPYGNLTRGMIVTILHRLEGKPATAYTGTFTDVAADLWYTEGIEWAAANGIVNGYGDGTFGPNDDVTREQLAAILYRYAGFKGYKIRTEGFTSADLAAVSKWAAEAMDWAVANDVLWVSNTLVRPTEKALRWEVAVAVRALLEYVAK